MAFTHPAAFQAVKTFRLRLAKTFGKTVRHSPCESLQDLAFEPQVDSGHRVGENLCRVQPSLSTSSCISVLVRRRFKLNRTNCSKHLCSEGPCPLRISRPKPPIGTTCDRSCLSPRSACTSQRQISCGKARLRPRRKTSHRPC